MEYEIKYKRDVLISVEDFIDLLIRSTLAERRPIDDRLCMQGMLDNSDLVISAWIDEKLIGIARSLTDFNYACYLSDLAVDKEFQRKGIGKRLQEITKNSLGPKCNIILVAAPEANGYYKSLHYVNTPRCWIQGPSENIYS